MHNIAAQMLHLDPLRDLTQQLLTLQQIDQHEASLRELENKLIGDNLDLIKDTARHVGKQFIANPSINSATSFEEACVQRYIYAPILYKLGFTQEAAKLNQTTFVYLFPQLHQIIEQKIASLFGPSLEQNIYDVMQIFIVNNPNILQIQTRKKSAQAIWKKITSLSQLNSMNASEFAQQIHDFIGIRWSMRVNPNENRYDALLNGVQLIPQSHIIHFRNQQVTQADGFFNEPVMKFYYIINQLPIELQLLGGLLEPYLSAKGYTQHKTGYDFQNEKLTATEQNARLGLCIYYGENDLIEQFHKLMLIELINEEKISYNTSHLFTLDTEPKLSSNRSLRFTECDTPIYQLAQYEFASQKMSLTM